MLKEKSAVNINIHYASICKLAHPYAFNKLHEIDGLQNLKLSQTGQYVIMLNELCKELSIGIKLYQNYCQTASNCDLPTHRLRYKGTSLL